MQYRSKIAQSKLVSLVHGCATDTCLRCSQEEQHMEAAKQMVDYWKEEAQQLTAKLQASNVAALELEVQQLQQRLSETEGKQLDAETQVRL